MPIYHFHLADGDRDPDRDGHELPDAEAAKIEAVRFAGELLLTRPRGLWDKKQWRVEVTNDDNVMMWAVLLQVIDTPSSNDEAGAATNRQADDQH